VSLASELQLAAHSTGYLLGDSLRENFAKFCRLLQKFCRILQFLKIFSKSAEIAHQTIVTVCGSRPVLWRSMWRNCSSASVDFASQRLALSHWVWANAHHQRETDRRRGEKRATESEKVAAILGGGATSGLAAPKDGQKCLMEGEQLRSSCLFVSSGN